MEENNGSGGEKLLTLAQVILAAEGTRIPLKIDRPGFTRIMVDLQEQLRKPFASIEKAPLRLGIANIVY
ncbi:MAG: hypothetical protein ABIG96_05700 [Candidatus Micrarchaeota archaeon]